MQMNPGGLGRARAGLGLPPKPSEPLAATASAPATAGASRPVRGEHDRRRERVLSAAVAAGKLSPGEVNAWAGDFDRDPAGTERVIARLAACRLPSSPARPAVGASGGPAGGTAAPAAARREPASVTRARASMPTPAGRALRPES